MSGVWHGRTVASTWPDGGVRPGADSRLHHPHAVRAAGLPFISGLWAKAAPFSWMRLPRSVIRTTGHPHCDHRNATASTEKAAGVAAHSAPLGRLHVLIGAGTSPAFEFLHEL